ncbi:Serine/Threonine kinase domain protein (macronuclear) [Tetrahymena thermophila SB210]|uniref:non-specific serine/threonine protein kinase n=1 Tax=Tetrahymena thermophila (strain SB210) TaxID=312017 RepID=Q22W91_TETTS|nr:Serine/Threonine kinase domain protein [Tetrahymena thermophila SB210]EAR89526.2 Serine/Threonine kinase domain protein [Tetrahymena thermophila SB210]|eukprot:XP_001009771.2 Serine/Threonine kinase domain protein [Tetrahymena thermophila SB210]
MNQNLQQQDQQYTMYDFRGGIEEYDNLVKLGQGSYGVVYKGRKKSDGKTYVIKEINMKFMDQKQKQDAVNEGNLLKHLESPYVVKYYDMFIEQNDLYIVMEFCENGDLLQYIKKQKNQFINENKIWLFFLQMLLGLHSIHQQKVLHRDFKTMNIFLTKNSTEIRIGDLGVAKYLGDTNNLAKTMVGTPYYLSPEICEEKPYNEKSDIWSLGCILYELCTFKHPFEASNQGALVIKILKNKVEPLPSMYSRELQSIISLLLTKDHQKRPDTTTLLSNSIIVDKLNLLKLPYPLDADKKHKRVSSMSIEVPKSKETFSQAKQEKASRSPNGRRMNNQIHATNHSIDQNARVGSISNLNENKEEKHIISLQFQSTLPSNVDKQFMQEIFKKRSQGIIQAKGARNKSEKSDKHQNNQAAVPDKYNSPSIPHKVFQLSNKNSDYDQNSIENAKQSSFQNLSNPKNLAKEQQAKLESIIQNQRNIFFQPLQSDDDNLKLPQNQKMIKKNSSMFTNYSQKKEKYISEKSPSPQANREDKDKKSQIQSVNDYLDQIILQNQRSGIYNDQVIYNSKQNQNFSSANSNNSNNNNNNNNSPNQFMGKKYFTPKIKSVRQTSINQHEQLDKLQNEQIIQKNNSISYQSQSSKNINLPNPSPVNARGKKNLNLIDKLQNEKLFDPSNQEQMKQINIFAQNNQINQIGGIDHNQIQYIQDKLSESQTYFNNLQNYNTKLPEIQSTSNLSTRPKSNVNIMDVFSQKNNQNFQLFARNKISQQLQVQPSAQFQFQQQYTSRKNSSKNSNQQNNFNNSIFTNSSCIQLNNQYQTMNNQQQKNTIYLDSPGMIKGDPAIQQQMHQKQLDFKMQEDQIFQLPSNPVNLKKSQRNIDQENISSSQFEKPKRKTHRTHTVSESKQKKNNKSFQFDENIQVSTYSPQENVQIMQSQHQIKDFEKNQYNSNPNRYSKYSMIETTIDTQMSMKELNEEMADMQQKYFKDRYSLEQKLQKKNIFMSSTTKSSQNSTQIGTDEKQLNRLNGDYKRQEGPALNQYNSIDSAPGFFKSDEDQMNDNYSSIYSDKKQYNGLSTMLNQNEIKKYQNTPTLPKIKQQLPISRNQYSQNINLQNMNNYNQHIQSYQTSNTNSSLIGSQKNQYNNKFYNKDILELNQMFEQESNKINSQLNSQQNINLREQIYNHPQNNNNINYNNEMQQNLIKQYDISQNNRKRGTSSAAKRLEVLESEIIDLQSQIANRQKMLNQQLGINQFSDLYQILKQKIKNIQDLEQCNMKEIDSIINSCIQNCNSKTMSNIYSLLKLHIKLEKAQQEYDTLKWPKNY